VLSGEHEEGISEEADEYRSIPSSLQHRTQRPPEEVCPGSAERTVRIMHYLDLWHSPRSIVGPVIISVPSICDLAGRLSFFQGFSFMFAFRSIFHEERRLYWSVLISILGAGSYRYTPYSY